MRTWILVSMMSVGLMAGTLTATEQDAKERAQKGYNTFKEVLSGDHAKLPDAIRYMEEAHVADETSVPNLFNLARAYFFDGVTFNKAESIAKAERTFARVVELDPSRTDALAFHGSILAQLSGGRDMAMFMRGAQEMKTAFEKTPNDITVRIVLGFVAFNLPAEARPFIGMKDPVQNLTLVGNAFSGLSSDFAPHANVVMNAFIGEAALMSGNKEAARASFKKALSEPQPLEEGQMAGRKRLESTIVARMNGGEKPVFADALFSGCNSCHLSAPDKLLNK